MPDLWVGFIGGICATFVAAWLIVFIGLIALWKHNPF